ncbi:hypothetical protein FEE95_00810 [Maribacter algarum]|uniref:Uncharacterized protein n=1 Tax=Maribacter algarum (ex Zhang et al. 2020) TaxID=2578118 RepID=A0A5S3PSU3_9FLAO|nr:hypothetical protein [Maribacter algarum]TMM58000.1 hypothetical protein FEE95_00810 [Maribacter algarum]
MIALFKHRWNRIAVRLATIGLFFGTLLMLTALMAENDLIITIGIVFLVLYIPITLVILFILFINTMANLKNIHEHVMALIIVVMNFPIALLYIYFINP